MIPAAILVAHIIVVGYWFGAELVINSGFRYAARAHAMPRDERSRLLAHVMDVDQHVRYALVLQAMLGTMLAALYGLVPGGETLAWAALVVGIAWLVFVEATHRLRGTPLGARLAAIDRASRYPLIALLLGVALGLVGGGWPLPAWLRLKLALFAGVIACGIGIRLSLIGFFRRWQTDGPLDEAGLEASARQGTWIVVLLWCLIGGIVYLSVAKG